MNEFTLNASPWCTMCSDERNTGQVMQPATTRIKVSGVWVCPTHDMVPVSTSDTL